MNIHCSACGALLPQKFCPARALPLTAIAMIDAEIWKSADKLQNRITMVSASTDTARRTPARLQTRLKALQYKATQ